MENRLLFKIAGIWLDLVEGHSTLDVFTHRLMVLAPWHELVLFYFVSMMNVPKFEKNKLRQMGGVYSKMRSWCFLSLIFAQTIALIGFGWDINDATFPTGIYSAALAMAYFIGVKTFYVFSPNKWIRRIILVIFLTNFKDGITFLLNGEYFFAYGCLSGVVATYLVMRHLGFSERDVSSLLLWMLKLLRWTKCKIQADIEILKKDGAVEKVIVKWFILSTLLISIMLNDSKNHIQYSVKSDAKVCPFGGEVFCTINRPKSELKEIVYFNDLNMVCGVMYSDIQNILYGHRLGKSRRSNYPNKHFKHIEDCFL